MTSKKIEHSYHQANAHLFLEFLRTIGQDEFRLISKCPYCRTDILVHAHIQMGASGPGAEPELFPPTMIARCIGCGITLEWRGNTWAKHGKTGPT